MLYKGGMAEASNYGDLLPSALPMQESNRNLREVIGKIVLRDREAAPSTFENQCVGAPECRISFCASDSMGILEDHLTQFQYRLTYDSIARSVSASTV
jgi:hypothetical protein